MTKLLFLFLLIGGYFWLASSGREEEFFKEAKKWYAYAIHKIQEMDIEWHIHGPTCE